MKIVLIALFFAISAFPQDPSSRVASACGPQNVSFDVKLDDSQHTIAQPDPGKAQVYFIQAKSPKPYAIGGTVVSTIGIDGTWVGENKSDSYFLVSVEPGEHHVCANVQATYLGHTMELSHFKAEAGNVYYFRERVVPTPAGVYLFLDLVDSDEAKYLIASYPLSISHLKK
jgi:hypothetical protein